MHAGPSADEHQPVRVGEGLRGVDELDRARDVDEPQRRQVDRDVGGGVGGAERGVERGLQHAPDLRPVGQVDLTREPQRGGRRSGDPQQRVVVQRGCDQLGGVDLAHRGHGLVVKEAPIEPAEHTGARMPGQQAVDGRLVRDELAQPADRHQLAGLTREPDARPPLALGFADRLAHELDDVGYGEGAELARALGGDDDQAAVGEGARHGHPVVGEPAEQAVGGVVLEVDDALTHREPIRHEGGRGLPQVVLAVGDETGVPDATLVDRADPRHTHSLGVCCRASRAPYLPLPTGKRTSRVQSKGRDARGGARRADARPRRAGDPMRRHGGTTASTRCGPCSAAARRSASARPSAVSTEVAGTPMPRARATKSSRGRVRSSSERARAPSPTTKPAAPTCCSSARRMA